MIFWQNRPFIGLTSLVSIDEEMVGCDCLLRTNGGGGVVDLSSDFVCRGGIGGGRETFIAFFFASMSIKRKGSL